LNQVFEIYHVPEPSKVLARTPILRIMECVKTIVIGYPNIPFLPTVGKISAPKNYIFLSLHNLVFI